MALLREQQQTTKQPPRRQDKGILGMVVVLLVVVGAVVLLARNVRLGGRTQLNTNSLKSNTSATLVNSQLEVIVPQITDEIRGKLAKGDFGVFVTPSLRSLKPGEKTTFTIRMIRADGAPKEYALALIGLPEKAIATFSTTTLKSETETSTAEVNIPAGTALGKYEMTIQAKAGIMTRTALAVLTVSDLAASAITTADVRRMDTGTKWQASFVWKTDVPANTWVEYATEQTFIASNQEYAFTANDTSNSIDHGVTVSYLEPKTTYHFRIRSVDHLGNTVISDDQAFLTR